MHALPVMYDSYLLQAAQRQTQWQLRARSHEFPHVTLFHSNMLAPSRVCLSSLASVPVTHALAMAYRMCAVLLASDHSSQLLWLCSTAPAPRYMSASVQKFMCVHHAFSLLNVAHDFIVPLH